MAATTTKKELSSFSAEELEKYNQGSEHLARKLVKLLGETVWDGKPVTEGMVYAAIGEIFAAKAHTDEDCQKIVRTLVTAISSRYQIRKVGK